MIKKKDLIGLIEPHLFNKINDHEHIIEKINPKKLVTFNRLDIGFKTLFLELQSKNYSLANKIYKNDLRVQTKGSFVDPDNDEKDNFNLFKDVFVDIVNSLKKGGFNKKKSLIPVSKDGSILNGAHRFSAALHLNLDVWIVRTSLPSIYCDYNYFSKNLIPTEIIEMAVLKLLNYSNNTHIAFLWPSGEKNWEKSTRLFSNIIYKKDIDLTSHGAFNLLYKCYSHMHDWIGTKENNFKGIQKKKIECFPSNFKVRYIIFQEPQGFEQVKKIKKKIREINNVGYSSIHITDNTMEITRLAHWLLNKNNFHFLNYTNNFDYIHSKKLKQLKIEMKNENILSEDLIVDGSFVLEAYGLRKSNDLDILTAKSIKANSLKNWERHDKELSYHGQTKEELIFNPNFYINLFGFKIISLDQLILFKKKRNHKKDILDISLADAITTNKLFNSRLIKLRQNYLYFMLRSKQILFLLIIKILKYIKLYEIIKKFKKDLIRIISKLFKH
jgi:hypothetical protein